MTILFAIFVDSVAGTERRQCFRVNIHIYLTEGLFHIELRINSGLV